jgi:hypothetical protein
MGDGSLSVVGAQGTQGTQGLQGTLGTQGLTGTQGIQGLQGATASISLNTWRYTATGGETTLSGTDGFSTTLAYTVGAEQVFINGVLLVRGTDYTASTGTSITGLTALVAGDSAVVESPNSFSVANAIPLSTVTAKGDLLAATGASTVTNLPVGADGSTLVANSASATGVAWTAGNPIPNPVLNSAFQVWQRGTSFTVGAASPYTADRWQANRGGLATGLTVSRQVTGDTTNLPFIQYAARIQRDSGNTSTATTTLWQNFESINSIPFAGKTVTFSFYARAGAQYSSTSNLLNINLYSGTGTDQNVNVAGFTSATQVITTNSTLTTNWQRFTYTGTVAPTATQLAMLFVCTPTNTAGPAGANDYFDITGIQLDIGSVALPFRTYAGTLQGELAACQRYYYRSTQGLAYSAYAMGVGATNTIAEIPIFNPTTMRTNPTSVDYSNLQVSDYGGNSFAVSAIVVSVAGSQLSMLDCTTAGTLTVSRPYVLRNNNNAAGFLGLSAEL